MGQLFDGWWFNWNANMNNSEETSQLGDTSNKGTAGLSNKKILSYIKGRLD